MMPDTIMKELWSVKDGIAKEHNYNIDSLVAALKSRELAAGPGLISRHAEEITSQAKRLEKPER